MADIISISPYTLRVFTLGGYPYTAPQKCGAGVFMRFREEFIRAFKQSHPDQKPTAENLTRWEQEMSEVGAYEALNIQMVFRALLTPAEGSPSLETGIDIASQEEVGAVMDFFSSSDFSKPVEQPSSQQVSGSTTPTKSTRTSSTRKRGK